MDTPNGRKVSIMLEECGLDCAAHPVNIAKDRAVRSGFLAISPNNEILAIVDNGKSLMESGAMHLAEKAGRFWPRDGKGKWRTMEWLMFQMGGVGPMFGQCHHFAKYSKAPYAEERYETRRLYGVMDRRLGVSACLAGAEYGIAV